MGLFGGKSEGGTLDVIRCDEPEYLIWKWRPSGLPGSSRKENAIRWGSSLRVKDGEVAVFVYKQPEGPLQDYIEGPFDATLETANFPVLSNIIGAAFAGKSPFQAEVYFINLQGNIRIPFGVPYFSVFTPGSNNYSAPVAARGSLLFNIQDYRGFIKKQRLINFELESFRTLIKEAVVKNVKGVIANVPIDQGIPVLQIERRLLEINELIEPRIRRAFQESYGVNLQRFDLDAIEVDKDSDDYQELRRVTADLETAKLEAEAAANVQNIQDLQRINADNMAESLAIQRAERQRFQRLQTETQHLAAHQIDRQSEVLEAAAASLGSMSSMSLGGSGGGSGGGFNPVGVMTGLAVGGAMGGQMAGMMNLAGQTMQQPLMTPPPMPQIAYSVAVNGQTTGPFNWSQLQNMVRLGQLNPSMHVWKQGMSGWEYAKNVPELAPLFAATPPPPPPPESPPPPPGA
jgi:membrane protease subunit (stomatin/prohibitin family)